MSKILRSDLEEGKESQISFKRNQELFKEAEKLRKQIRQNINNMVRNK